MSTALATSILIVEDERLLARDLPIAVAYFDAQGKVQFANQVFRELVPYQDNPIGVAASTVLGWVRPSASWSTSNRIG